MPHHGGRCVSLTKRSVLTPQIGFQFECPECQRQDYHGGQLCNFLLVGTSPLHCWSQDVPSVFLINIYYVFSFPSILDLHCPGYYQPTVATDENEKFALLAFYGKGNNDEIILLFTEEKGFVQINNLNATQCSNNHKRVVMRVK